MKILLLLLILSASCWSGAFAQHPAGNGAFGNALVLDGVDGYAWMSPNLAGADEGTVEMWISPNSTPSSYQLWSGGNGLPGTNGDWLMLGEHSLAPGFSMGIYTGSAWAWAGNGVLGSGSWTHVAGTWSPDGMSIYINGVLAGTHPHGGAAHNYAMELIGASAWGGSFDGAIDDVRIWSIARSASEIQATMDQPLDSSITGDIGSGLVAYYRFESFEDLGVGADGGDDIRDESVSGNHADTNGGVSLGTSTVPVDSQSWSKLKSSYGR